MNKNLIKEIFLGIIFLIIIFLLYKSLTLFDEYLTNKPQKPESKIFVYACPIEQSTKCYEVPADEIKCTYKSNEGCEEYETTIYLSNDKSLYLICHSLNSGKFNCLDEEDHEWEIEESSKKIKTKEQMEAEKKQEEIIKELLPK